MNIEEYEQATREVMERALARLKGIGAEQYSIGERQLFEGKPLAKIGQDVCEELEDAIVYLTQIHIRISNLIESITK